MNLAEAIRETFSNHNKVLLGLDFDGVLAELVDHPDLAVPDPQAIELVGRLADKPTVTVVIVSGRSRDDLADRLGELPGVALVGEHGNDLGGDSQVPSPALAEAKTFIERLHRANPGSVTETKPSSVTIHTRNLVPEVARCVASEVRDWAGRHQADITLLEGKHVLELTVATGTKGDAIAAMSASVPAVIYLGDDATDETVFDILGPDDIGVKVGPGETSARFRVEDVPGVVEVLEMMDLASQ